MSAKYDELLNQFKRCNDKISSLTYDVKNIKQDLNTTQKRTLESKKEIDDLAQYLRRDCIEISGLKPTEDMSCNDLVKAIAKDMDLELDNEDISIAHPLPTFNKTDSKIIVKFTRRSDRDDFYSSRKKVAGRQGINLYNLNEACEDLDVDLSKKIYVSESLTPMRKKLFGSVNKIKKDLRWKYIWTNNGRIYLKQGEKSHIYKFDTTDDLEEFKKKLHIP